MDGRSENAIKILFLDVCMKIEELSAEIYHYFGDVYAGFPDAVLLWSKTALEEENHRRQFELVLHLRDEAEFDIQPADLQRALRIHGKIISLLDIVKHKTPDLIGAVTLAIEMEENLADLHVQTAVRFRDESLGEAVRGSWAGRPGTYQRNEKVPDDSVASRERDDELIEFLQV